MKKIFLIIGILSQTLCAMDNQDHQELRNRRRNQPQQNIPRANQNNAQDRSQLLCTITYGALCCGVCLGTIAGQIVKATNPEFVAELNAKFAAYRGFGHTSRR